MLSLGKRAAADLPSAAVGFGLGGTVGGLAGVAGAAGLALPALVAAYGAGSAPQGRRLHGAASTLAQTGGTLAGGLAGGGVGMLGAANVAQLLRSLGYSTSTANNASLAVAPIGAVAGGLLGNYLAREAAPGPQQLGLGERQFGDPLTKKEAAPRASVHRLPVKLPRSQ